MLILGIETSCDETAAAIVKAEKGKIDILSNIVSSQVKLHAKWGGVVPNLAAREHLKNILPIVKNSLKESGVSPEDLDLIAVTNGPGLIPALLIGTTTAKTFSYLWKKPLLGIHHIEGHIYANFFNKNKKNEITFPALCLVVSGGHTQLVLMKKHLEYKIIGETLDDAAGEAFDKVARILGLGYPGGPVIAKAAELTTPASRPPLLLKEGLGVVLPRPMFDSKDFNFSFSGLKTAVLYLAKKNENKMNNPNFISSVAQEFQQSAVDVLVHKTILAAKKYKVKTVMMAGGVSANQELRRQLGEAIKKNFPSVSYNLPDIKHSLDNAAMIAIAAYYRWQKIKDKKKFKNNWKTLKTEAGLKLKSFK
jgi:N6-L-threonylcarbamoyladenine synthase